MQLPEKDEVAIPLVDLGCLTSTVKTVFWTLLSPTTIAPSNNIRIKVVANLRRIDATANTQNILFVATYPATLTTVTNIGTPGSCPTPLQLPVSSSLVNNYCTSPAYTGSGRFPQRGKSYEDLVKDLEESERLLAAKEYSNTFEVYPNPAQNSVEISYSVSQNSLVELSIINSVGQQKQIFLENKEAGTYKARIDFSNYQAGIYLCELTINGKTFVKKLVITK